MASCSSGTSASEPTLPVLLVSKRGAAKLLSVSERTIDNLRAASSLPWKRVGSRVLFSPDELRTWLSQNQNVGTSLSLAL